MSGTISTRATLLSQFASTQPIGGITPLQTQNLIASMASVVAPRNAQTASYSLVLSDVGSTVDFNAVSGVTLTIPLVATIAFPVNSTLWVHISGNGDVTIAGVTGVTILQPQGLQAVASGMGALVEMQMIATNVWQLNGDLLPVNAAPPAPAIFIATNGNDTTGTGTYLAPYLTPTKAVAVATSGQMVLFRGGTYTITSTVTWSSANNNVTWMSYPGEIAIIDGGGTLDLMINMNVVIGVTIRGMQLQNSATSSPFYGCLRLYECRKCNIIGNYINNTYNGIYLDTASGNTVQGNKITNTFGVGGVYLGGGSNSNLIDSNIVDTTSGLLGGTGTTSGGIWGANCCNNQITHNIVRNCIGAAIALETISTNGCMNGNLIQYNYCPNNMTSTSANDCGVIYLYNAGLQLNNSTLVDSNYCEAALTSTSIQQVGIYLDNYVSGVTVTNNIVWICSFGILIHGGMNNTFQNNILNMNTITSANDAAGLFQALTGFTGGSMTNNQVTANMVYSTGTTAPTVWEGIGTPGVTISKNYYYNTNGQSMTTNSGGVSDTAPVTSANPSFTAPTKALVDYNMPGNTIPQFDGFTPINQTNIGLRTTSFVHWQVSWA